MFLRVGGGERFPDRLCGVKRLDRLRAGADLLGDLTHAEVGACQLRPKVGIVAPLSHEALVIVERGAEQLLTQAANVDGVLMFEERVFADARQVVFHGLQGEIEVGFGLLADIGFAASGAVGDNEADRCSQGDPEQGGGGRVSPDAMLAQAARAARSRACSG